MSKDLLALRRDRARQHARIAEAARDALSAPVALSAVAASSVTICWFFFAMAGSVHPALWASALGLGFLCAGLTVLRHVATAVQATALEDVRVTELEIGKA